MTTQMSRAEVDALPPTYELPVLGAVLGLSEPSVRKAYRSGELAGAGIRVVKFGARYVVIGETVREFLGLPPVPARSKAPRSTPGGGRPTGEGMRPARRLRAAGGGDGPG